MRRLGGMGALAIAAALLVSCSPATDRALTAPAAELQEDRVEWAFTQADQHPERKLVAVIDAAESSLDIAIYSLTYPDVVKAIRDAAKRGVNVRLIADRIQSGGKTQKEALKLLGSAGVPIKVNRHSGLMHLKMTIADGKVATTGSFNYSKAASTTNDEIFVEFRDEEIARSFAEQFEAMWEDEERFEPLDAAVAMDESSSAPEAGGKAGNAKDIEADDEGNEAVKDGDVAGNESETADDAPGSALAACSAPEIKGNVNSAGDKIYHVPGSAQYDRTKAEEMFCTEADAKAAGFRKAKQ